ncbi:MAG TPA: hypothetical protein VF228_01180 [Iamia sp.]
MAMTTTRAGRDTRLCMFARSAVGHQLSVYTHHHDEPWRSEMKRMTKPTAALATAVAMLFLLAAPASAFPPQAGTVTAGTITVPLGTPGTITADLSTTSPCTDSSLTVTPNATTPSTGGAIALSIPQGAFDFGPTTSNTIHVLVATVVGTYTNTPAGTTPVPTTPQNYTINGSITANATNTAKIFVRTGTCTPTTTNECGPIGTTITFNGSTFLGTIDADGVLDGTATINGSGTLSAFGCAAPFSTINTRVLTITNMTVDF